MKYYILFIYFKENTIIRLGAKGNINILSIQNLNLEEYIRIKYKWAEINCVQKNMLREI